MKKRKSNAVVLGLGGANALGVVRSLGYEGIPSIGFHMGERKLDAHRSKYLGEMHVVTGRDELLEAMVKYGKMQDEKGVVFPTGDDYISFCSESKKILRPYFHLPHSSVGDLSDLIEKEDNSKIGENAGFRVPRSLLLRNYNDITGGPVIVKPLNSVVGGKGDMRMYNSDEELFRERDGLLERHGDMLVQDFVPGDNSNLVEVHAYKSSNGVIIAGMQRNELGIQANPFVYMGVVFRSVWDEGLVKPSSRLADQLDFNGALDINLKKSDFDGEYYFMEVNLRTSANLSLDTAEGVNLPAIIYHDLRGEDFGSLFPVDGTEVGGAWVHESRIKRFFDQGGIREDLLDSLKNVKANAFYDSLDSKPFELNGGFAELDSGLLKKIKAE